MPASLTANARAAAFRDALRTRIIIADGAMGTMIQAAEPSLEDYRGHEGCNEILNLTRPELIGSIHDAYLHVGVDAIETNTFGANWSNLADYGIEDQIEELSFAGAQIARERADAASTPDAPRFVLGAMGPGTKLPSLGHTTYAHLKETFCQQAQGLLRGGVDALLIETCQDILQAKAAIAGARLAFSSQGRDVAILVSITMETTGTMLLGTDIAAALTSLRALHVDAIGLNCATGPDRMSEHLRHLSRHSELPIMCLPNAGLPELGPHGASYPLTPDQLAQAHHQFAGEFGLGLLGGCCGTTPEHLAAVVQRLRGIERPVRHVTTENGVSSLYSHTDLRQDTTFLAIGERTNANGSKAFREALLAGDDDECLRIARNQMSDGAHLLDVCVDYVGRDGVADIRQVVSRLASAVTVPLVIDSTEPAVIQAGLELLGGRCVVNSVNFEDGDGPESRFQRIMPLVREHGAAVVALTIDEEGQARTAATKIAIATRLITELTSTWGMETHDIIVDCLTFPVATGQEETRRDAIETLEAIRYLHEHYPELHTTLGISNVSFGLKPAARMVLNSVFLHEAVAAGLDSAIVHASKIVPWASIPEAQRDVALDVIWDRRTFDDQGNVTYDPLARLLEIFSDIDPIAVKNAQASAMAALPVRRRLERRIITGDRIGLDDDLTAALADGASALDIINDDLLAGMKEVGELFGSGQMQLPFVLQSAEVMKHAVAWLEPHLPKTSSNVTKGTIVLATVRGDVHDIGKNLVDIILTNNGYHVINIGIKQSIGAMIDAATAANADVIGMSGLLVKSTVIMRENLAELTSQGLAHRWPILLGGAALTRPYVEDDLASEFPGVVRYAKDAFEGLRLMEPLVAIARGADRDSVGLPPLARRRHQPSTVASTTPMNTVRSRHISADNPIPRPPFWGTRIAQGMPLLDIVSYLDERATFMGQWGLKPGRGVSESPVHHLANASYEQLAAEVGRPRLASWMDRIRTEQIIDPTVVYGYFPCWSEGNDVVIAWPPHHALIDADHQGEPGTERLRFTFPRQTRDRELCLADFIKPREWVQEHGQFDVLPIQLVTMGASVSQHTAILFEQDKYREYLELHGLTVQLTEALAELWHARIRADLGFADAEPADLEGVLKVQYRGARFSLGYPACPNLADRGKVVELLQPERIGVTLSDELQLHPEQSTDALCFHHPEAKYFSV